ncbi:hypothetical protein LOK49_LG02G02527 [Camellia lanceoleosa]|uniref:Uncharacterized protein n=1 Tax=Camellia lanceoleosa TaxID=1840588 RepID=A0ACC0IQZ4_9ERIC|nr:hypothetical protein LOK49_LG02G02527 [Camellia lanceoleosa]
MTRQLSIDYFFFLESFMLFSYEIEEHAYAYVSVLLEIAYESRYWSDQSLRNCSLQGPIPDLSRIPHLAYIAPDERSFYNPDSLTSHDDERDFEDDKRQPKVLSVFTDLSAQVRKVFIDCLPSIWEEDSVKEHFKKFGRIEKVELARNMPN